MLDLTFIETNAETVKANAAARGYDVDVDHLLAQNAKRKRLQQEIDDLRRRANEIAKGFKTDASEARREEARALNAQEAERREELKGVEQEVNDLWARVPNVLDPRVPMGDETKFEVLRVVGTPPAFSFKPKSHEAIGTALDVLDIPRAARAAKTRFYALKNEAVLMRMALVRMFYEHCRPQGFELVSTPVLAKDKSLFTSGYLPFSQKDNFRIAGEDLSLIGTSEQAILGMFMDETLTKLPVLMLGDSLCFRTEAGAAGRDTTGILRAHQFYKLEQMVLCHPDESEKWHLRCLENEEWLMRELGVHYRVIVCSSADMAAPGRMKYDTEAWLPTQNTFREMTSNTNLSDYQARRGGIKFKVDGSKGFVHTISATGFVDRLLAVILECFQQEDGSVKLPPALVPYMNGVDVLRPKATA